MATIEHISEVMNKPQQLEMEPAVVKDLFNHGARSSQAHSGDSKLNFRQTQRHVPKEFSGNSGGMQRWLKSLWGTPAQMQGARVEDLVKKKSLPGDVLCSSSP